MKMHRMKRTILTLLFAATAIVLFYAEEDWRGARELDRVKRELEAKEESLDPKILIPPPIPDELNVAAAPIFAELYEKDPQHLNETRLAQLNSSFNARPSSGYPRIPSVGSSTLFSIGVFQKWFTGKEDPTSALADVQAGLEKFRPLADEVEAALARPGVRWPVTSPEDPFAEKMPYFQPVLQLARFFDLRALTEIEAGQGEAALHDLGIIFRLSEVVEHRFLIGYLVGNSCDSIGYGLIADGLQKDAWNDSQLNRLAELLAPKNYLQNYQEAIRQERISTIHFNETPLHERLILLNLSSNSPPSWKDKAIVSGLKLLPRGWSALDEAYGLEIAQKGWIDSVDSDRGTFDVGAGNEVALALKRDLSSGRQRLLRPFSAIGLPALLPLQRRAAVMQANLNEARIACALERYRPRNGALPETLDELVPAWLPSVPPDPIGGAPLRYRKQDDGYLLYSIGWNQKDDGGVIARKPGEDHPDLSQGDWVWASRPDLYQFTEEKVPQPQP